MITPVTPPVTTPVPPSARSVRHRLRPPALPWRFRVARLYPHLVNGVIVGAVGLGLAAAALRRTGTASASAWTALFLSVLAATVFLKVLLSFGPVFAGRDRVCWVLSSPVDRAALLWPRFVALLAGGGAAGVVWPAVVFGVVGTSAPVSPWLFVASAAVGAGLVSGAVVLQRLRARAQAWLSGVAVLSVAALFVRPASFGGFAVAWLAPFAVLAVFAAMSLRHLRRSDLAAGAALAGVVRVSVSWFDLDLLGAILAERRARALGRVRSVRLRGFGGARSGLRSDHPRGGERGWGARLTVLVWADVLRLWRAPNSMFVWAALLPVPALVALGGEVDLVSAVHLVAAFLATDRLAAGLRTAMRSPAIRRAFGLPEWQLRLAHLVFPAVGAVVWCAVTMAFTPHVSVPNAVVSAAGAVAVVYRIATRPPIDYGAAIVGFGAYGSTPLGLIVQLGRGPFLLFGLAALQGLF